MCCGNGAQIGTGAWGRDSVPSLSHTEIVRGARDEEWGWRDSQGMRAGEGLLGIPPGTLLPSGPQQDKSTITLTG